MKLITRLEELNKWYDSKFVSDILLKYEQEEILREYTIHEKIELLESFIKNSDTETLDKLIISIFVKNN